VPEQAEARFELSTLLTAVSGEIRWLADAEGGSMVFQCPSRDHRF
jgi:hypothetical protein